MYVLQRKKLSRAKKIAKFRELTFAKGLFSYVSREKNFREWGKSLVENILSKLKISKFPFLQICFVNSDVFVYFLLFYVFFMNA